MKIKTLETFVVFAHRTNWVFVRLRTECGLEGVGEGTLEGMERAVVAVLDEMAEYLVGQDPRRVEHHAAEMTRDAYWRSGPVFRSALSAVEAAMFDIKGKALGVPVYELLGGRCRDLVPCYANGWFAGANGPDDYARMAQATVAAGFPILKFDPLGKAYLRLDPDGHADALTIVGAVREAVGDRVGLIIEGHGRLDTSHAIRFGRDLEAFQPLFYEEPIPPESVDALADVRRAIRVPVATGERYFDRHRFAELLARDAADLLQPDICHVGGLIETKAIAALAAARYLAIAPHNPMGPVGNAMALHVAASTPNFEFLETVFTDVPWRAEIADEDVSVTSGQMSVPDRPGLGVTLNEAAMARFPYQRQSMRRQYAHVPGYGPKPGAVPWYRTEAGPLVAQ